MQRAKKKTVIITFRNGCNPSLPHFSSDPILFDVPRTATADLAKSNAVKRSHDGSATDEWSAKRVKNTKAVSTEKKGEEEETTWRTRHIKPPM